MPPFITHPGTINFANYSILILINTKDKLRKCFNYKEQGNKYRYNLLEQRDVSGLLSTFPKFANLKK